jgi:serine/threonine-protein kinase
VSDDAKGRTLLATPAPGGGGEATLESPPSADSLIGKELAGRYKIDRKLGEGGMGSVYVATHTTLEKMVAVKILHGEYARKPDLIERFLQEAKAASKIRHENVIDITDFGTTEDGLVFFCMELLAGEDLHELLTRAKIEGQPLPWSRAAPIFLQVCAALHAAHQAGVIHRDLKPENIFLIDWLGNPEFVKLLDFGIAKMTSVEGSEDGRKLTKTGMLFGTPEYMSPEQARGDKPDARVDVYAMGCILYQLIAGDTPFSGDSFMAVLSQHLTAEPPVVTPEQLARVDAPAGLAGVVARTLVKDRDARYQTIKELADAVRQVSAGMGLTGRHPMPDELAPATGAGQQQAVPEKMSPKSQWTGSARLPAAQASDTVEPGAGRTKNPAKMLWMAVAAVVVLGGGAVAAIALAGGGSSGDASPAGPTEPAITAPDPGETEPAPRPDQPAPETPVETPVEDRPEDRPVETRPIETRPIENRPVETPPVETVKKTCAATQRWSDTRKKCVDKVVEPVETDPDVKPGEVETKNPFDD